MKPEILKCQDCGVENDTVSDTFCPYAEELHDELVRITVCAECYQERVWAI